MGTEATVASQRVYEGRLVNLRVDTVRLENGRLTEREIVEHPGAVAVVALDEDDNAILVRQFRKAAEKKAKSAMVRASRACSAFCFFAWA